MFSVLRTVHINDKKEEAESSSHFKDGVSKGQGEHQEPLHLLVICDVVSSGVVWCGIGRQMIATLRHLK